jgi:hypothetical protein
MESLTSSADFKELLSLFNAGGVRFIVVGAFALAYHGWPRYTKDIDIWVDPSGANPRLVFEALAKFGAPLEGMTPADFADPDSVFQIGVEPVRIDILNSISGVDFSQAWKRKEQTAYGEIPVWVIGREDYVANKRASGRPSDLRDIAALEEASQ